MSFFKYDAVELRFKRTISFIEESLQPPAKILDLGTPNELGRLIASLNYDLVNTSSDLDLDKNPEALQKFDVDAVTAFEILEHLLNPLDVLKNLPCDHLFATIPLRLWFSSAYRNPKDPWDRHFHEFEDWQFDWLLEQAGWEIIRRQKWTSPVKKIGLRPIFRIFTHRYYAVEAVREKNES